MVEPTAKAHCKAIRDRILKVENPLNPQLLPQIGTGIYCKSSLF